MGGHRRYRCLTRSAPSPAPADNLRPAIKGPGTLSFSWLRAAGGGVWVGVCAGGPGDPRLRPGFGAWRGSGQIRGRTPSKACRSLPMVFFFYDGCVLLNLEL